MVSTDSPKSLFYWRTLVVACVLASRAYSRVRRQRRRTIEHRRGDRGERI